jgi:predicted dehydrogenase
MADIKIAIVGAGSMAREHIRAFSSLSGVRIVGISSRTRARAQGLADEFNIPVVADSVAELKAKTDASLVIVTVPELAANAVAKACFVENWAVLLEKPAGYDLADAQDIAAAAFGRAQPVMVGFNRRFYSSVLAVRNDIDNRDEKRFIHIQDQQSYAEARRYNHPEPVVAKFMYANSIHVIDLMLALGRGPVVGVNVIMPWKGEETEVMLAHITFESGDSALYEGIWKGPGPWACSVSTPSRRWVMQPLERAAFQNAGERVQNQVPVDPVDTEFKAGFVLQAKAVLARLRGEPSAAIDINRSLEAMRLIHRIFGV